MNRVETLPSQPGYSKAAGPGGRLLIVTQGIPHPTEGGSTVVFYEYIKAAKAAGFTILNLLLLQPDNASEARLSEYRRGLEEPGRFEVVTCSSERFITLHRLRITFDKVAMTPVRDRILAFDPDAVLALDIMAAWAIAELPLKGKVVWLGDLNFETLWYGAIYGRREGNRGLKDLVGNTLYAVIWALVYRKVLRRFDSVIVCAKSSERAIGRLGVKARYLPYPWPQLSNRPRDASRLSPVLSLLFFGGLGGLGSRSAFHFLLDDLYPILVEEFGSGGFHVVICGRGNLPTWAQAAIDARRELKFEGYIADLDGVMDQCHAMLAPIDVPVGNRTRILTAISRHLLVIAHRNTALGNPDLRDGETCYLASTASEFSQKIRLAVENRVQTERIVETAYQTYVQNFDPARAIPPVLAEIERVSAIGRS